MAFIESLRISIIWLHRPGGSMRSHRTFLLIVGLCLVADAGFAFDRLFTTRMDYFVGTKPQAICSGDFDGDLKLDQAVANFDSDSISILKGNGDGTFIAAGTYSVEDRPRSVCAADFNGDGWLDLAVANYGSNNVTILRNNGSGSFARSSNLPAGTGPETVCAADFDADGNPDLAASNWTSNNVSILRNRGDGTWDAAVNYAVGSNPYACQAGDFNGDSKSDVAVGNFSSHTISILMNNGTGAFLPAEDYAVGTEPMSICSADFNGDAQLDLAVTNSASDSISILENDGDGVFAAPVDYPAGDGPWSICAADFDGNGSPDAAIANALSNSVTVFLNNGDGTLADAVHYAAGVYSRFVCAADYDGDGKPDLAVANADINSISVFRNNGNGTFATSMDYGTCGQTRAVCAADLDGDGSGDLAAADYDSSKVSIMMNNGDGTLATAVDYAAGSTPISVCAADFDGDAHYDLALANHNSGKVSILKNNGDGTFEVPVDYDVEGQPFYVAAADFNGDGKADLVTAPVSILMNDGDGTFSHTNDYGAGTHPTCVHPADYDGDGLVDLAAANHHSNTVTILRGNGDGTFSEAENYEVGGYPRAVCSADFNGDGKLDLAAANSGSYSVSVLINNGSGGFGTAVDYGVGNHPWSIQADDFNADGKPDLAVANYDGGSVSILLNNGDGTFSTATNYGVCKSPSSICAADLDGDGYSDLATANTNARNVSVLINTSMGCNALAADLLTPPAGATVVGTPTLWWSAPDCADRAKIILSTDQEFTSVVWVRTVIGAESYYCSNTLFTSGQEYWWKIALMYDGQWVNWSTPRKFVYQAPGSTLPAVSLILPQDQCDVALPDIFSCSIVPGAASFEFVVAADVGFSTILYEAVSQRNAVVIPVNITGLSPGDIYYWKARAMSVIGAVGEYSSARTFTFLSTVAPPPAPTLLSPLANAVVVDDIVKFKWTGSMPPNMASWEQPVEFTWIGCDFMTPGRCVEHLGFDWGNSIGTQVKAIAKGYDAALLYSDGFGGCYDVKGYLLLVKHRKSNGEFFWALYGHVKNAVTTLPIAKGQVIAELADYDPCIHSDGCHSPGCPHLHFGIWDSPVQPSPPYGYDEVPRDFRDPIVFLASETPYLEQETTRPTSFQLQYSLDAAFPNIQGKTWTVAAITADSALVDLPPDIAGTIYWRVGSQNGSNEPRWSSPRTFSYSPESPPLITSVRILRPADGTEVRPGSILMPDGVIVGYYSGEVSWQWWLDSELVSSSIGMKVPSNALIVPGLALPTDGLSEHQIQIKVTSPVSAESELSTYRVVVPVARSAAKLRLRCNPSNIIADGISVITVTAAVIDDDGNVVTQDNNRTVNFSITEGSGTLLQSSASTVGGYSAVPLQVPSGPGTATVQALCSGLYSAQVTIHYAADEIDILVSTAEMYMEDLQSLRIPTLPASPYSLVNYDDEGRLETFLTNRILISNPAPQDTAALHRFILFERALLRMYYHDPGIVKGWEAGPAQMIPGALTAIDDFCTSFLSVSVPLMTMAGSLMEVFGELVWKQLINPLLGQMGDLLDPEGNALFIFVKDRLESSGLNSRQVEGFMSTIADILETIANDLRAGRDVKSIMRSNFLRDITIRQQLYNYIQPHPFSGIGTQWALDQALDRLEEGNSQGNVSEACERINGRIAYVAYYTGGNHAEIEAWQELNRSRTENIEAISAELQNLMNSESSWANAGKFCVRALELIEEYFPIRSMFRSIDIFVNACTQLMKIQEQVWASLDDAFGQSQSLAVAGGTASQRSGLRAAPMNPALNGQLMDDMSTSGVSYESAVREILNYAQSGDSLSVRGCINGYGEIHRALERDARLAVVPCIASASNAFATIADYDAIYDGAMNAADNARLKRAMFNLTLAHYVLDPLNPISVPMLRDRGLVAIAFTHAAQDSIMNAVTKVMGDSAVSVLVCSDLATPDSLVVGEMFEIAVSILALGGAPAMNAYVALSADSAFFIAGPDSIYLGTLNPGEDTLVTFTATLTDQGMAQEDTLTFGMIHLIPASEHGYGMSYGRTITADRSALTGTDEGDIRRGLANILQAAYPNPFNPTVTIVCQVAQPSWLRLRVYDARGCLVRILKDSFVNAGSHVVIWDGQNQSGALASSGVYFCRFEAEGSVGTRKLVLLR
jgi:hypothetical protein